MDRQYFHRIYLRVVAALMVLLLVFLAGIDYFIINKERQNRLAGIRTDLEAELAETAAFMVEPLLKFKFGEIEQFMQLWSTNHEDVISFKAITPQGSVLTEFRRESASDFRLVATKEVVFEGLRLM
jgi:hypothetical protein